MTKYLKLFFTKALINIIITLYFISSKCLNIMNIINNKIITFLSTLNKKMVNYFIKFILKSKDLSQLNEMDLLFVDAELKPGNLLSRTIGDFNLKKKILKKQFSITKSFHEGRGIFYKSRKKIDDQANTNINTSAKYIYIKQDLLKK